jgi:predicted glycosyltransferase
LTKKYNILICPLGWGLGHAGRMIPLAEVLQKAGHNILVGAGKENLAFFQRELSGLTAIHFPGFSPGYSAVFPQYFAVIVRLPVLLYHILTEHFRLKKLIRTHKIDIVISDNRFGLWNRKARTVYVTHQLLIPFPAGLRSIEWIGVRLHRFIIKRYNYCFVPDLPGDLNLSGRLSHQLKVPANVRYVGLLSRFNTGESYESKPDKISLDYVVVLSGPEPQRSILRKKVVNILKDIGSQTIILEGRPSGNRRIDGTDNIISYDHLPRNEMRELLRTTANIISRAGYSFIMELISLNRSAVLIPAPGQTEQEYLADYLSGKGWFTKAHQDKLSRREFHSSGTVPNVDLILRESMKLLESALAELLQ